MIHRVCHLQRLKAASLARRARTGVERTHTSGSQKNPSRTPSGFFWAPKGAQKTLRLTWEPKKRLQGARKTLQGRREPKKPQGFVGFREGARKTPPGSQKKTKPIINIININS